MIEQILNIQLASDEMGAPVFPTNVHICHFYKNKKDLLELMLPYFHEGLRRNEFCLWGVADPLTVQTAGEALDQILRGRLNAYVETANWKFST